MGAGLDGFSLLKLVGTATLSAGFGLACMSAAFHSTMAALLTAVCVFVPMVLRRRALEKNGYTL